MVSVSLTVSWWSVLQYSAWSDGGTERPFMSLHGGVVAVQLQRHTAIWECQMIRASFDRHDLGSGTMGHNFSCLRTERDSAIYWRRFHAANPAPRKERLTTHAIDRAHTLQRSLFDWQSSTPCPLPSVYATAHGSSTVNATAPKRADFCLSPLGTIEGGVCFGYSRPRLGLRV